MLKYNKNTLIKIIDNLKKNGVVIEIPEEDKKIVKSKKDPSLIPNRQFLRNIRANPKRVEIIDLLSEIKTIYPSIYKASKALNVNPPIIQHYNGRKSKDGKYFVKIL